MNSDEKLQEIATELHQARETGEQIPPLHDTHQLTPDEAYEIQFQLIEQLDAFNEGRLGYKIGATSRDGQEMLGIDEPTFGHLPGNTLFYDGTVPFNEFVDPRVEPEIGFIIGRDISGNLSYLEVLRAIEAVVPVIEVADSRIEDWQVHGVDLISDNSLAGGVIIGGVQHDFDGVDTSAESVRLNHNGSFESAGTGTKVLSDPIQALQWLVTKLDTYGRSLHEGELIISGAMTPALKVEPGDTVTAQFSTLGTLTATIY